MVPLEYIKSVRSYSKEPNGIGIVFDKKKASKDKNTKGSVREKYAFTTCSKEHQIQLMQEIAKAFAIATGHTLECEHIEGPLDK